MELKKAKQILNKDRDKKFTDEEIIEIMKFIKVLAEVSVKNFLKSMKNKKNNYE